MYRPYKSKLTFQCYIFYGSTFIVGACTQMFLDCLHTGRPKLFFIQACQGEVDNTPEHVQADAVGQMNHPTDDETWEDVEADDIPSISAPKGADMLTALATIKGSSTRPTNGFHIYRKDWTI